MIDFSGRNGSLEIFGVNLVGASAENGRKLLLTIIVSTARRARFRNAPKPDVARRAAEQSGSERELLLIPSVANEPH